MVNIETETPSYDGDGSHHLLLGTNGPEVQYHKLARYAKVSLLGFDLVF